MQVSVFLSAFGFWGFAPRYLPSVGRCSSLHLPPVLATLSLLSTIAAGGQDAVAGRSAVDVISILCIDYRRAFAGLSGNDVRFLVRTLSNREQLDPDTTPCPWAFDDDHAHHPANVQPSGGKATPEDAHRMPK